MCVSVFSIHLNDEQVGIKDSEGMNVLGEGSKQNRKNSDYSLQSWKDLEFWRILWHQTWRWRI